MRFHSMAALILGLILFPATPMRAQLAWKEKQISLQAPAGTQDTKTVFSFTNQGKKAVTIREIKSSCNCTVPKLEKKIYQPGEEGRVEVVFNHGSRTGLQKSTITVLTDDPKLSDAELQLVLEIKTWLQMSPPFVLWLKGSEPETREIALKMEPGVEVLSAKSEGDVFRVKKAVKEGTVQLQIRPSSTSKPVRSSIEIAARLPDGTTRNFTAYAIVK